MRLHPATALLFLISTFLPTFSKCDDDVDLASSSSFAHPHDDYASHETKQTTSIPLQAYNAIQTTWKERPVINLASLDEFDLLVGSGDYPYAIALLFTTNSAGSAETAETFSHLAKARWGFLEKNRNVTMAEIYFARVDFSRLPVVFKRLKVTKAPLLVYLAKRSPSIYDMAAGRADDDDGDDDNAKRWYSRLAFPANELPFTLEATAQWLERASGVERFAVTVLSSSASILVAGGGKQGGIEGWLESDAGFKVMRLILVSQVLFILGVNAKHFFRRRLGWAILSAFLYGISMSGTIFVVLRGMPPFGFNPSQGGFFLVYPDRQNQFMLEGFLVAFLAFGASLALVLSAFYATDRDLIEEELGEERRRVSPIPSGSGNFNRLSLYAVLFFLALIHMETMIFRKKAPWYPI